MPAAKVEGSIELRDGFVSSARKRVELLSLVFGVCCGDFGGHGAERRLGEEDRCLVPSL